MLSWSIVLKRIKDELALPFQPFEKTDEEIVEYLRTNALKKYSTYFPQKWRITLDMNDSDFQVPDRENEYFIIDPDDREIFNVVDYYPTLSNHLMLGHPFMGPFSFNGLEEWHLQTFKANNLRPWSNYAFNTEFLPPNRVRITPKFMRGPGVIEYERMHDPELSSLYTDHHDIFTDLCLGMTMMMIGRIRKKFTNIQTPFGTVEINADEIFSDGSAIYDRTMEILKAGTLPNIIFDKG